MLQPIAGLPDQVVALKAIGEVTDDDYEQVLDPAIAAGLAKHEKIRLLYVLGEDFTGYQAGAVWEDAKLGLRTFTSYEKIAVVTDADWVRRGVSAFGWLIPGAVKVFSDKELDEAKTWIVG